MVSGSSLVSIDGVRSLGGGFFEVPLDVVYRNKDQPRQVFDAESMRMLEESVRVHGVLQPIVVRPDGEGGLLVVAGERRVRAARSVGLVSVPARVEGDVDVGKVALLENLQRARVNPVLELEWVLGFVSELVDLGEEDVVRLLRRAKNGRSLEREADVLEKVKSVLFELGVNWLTFTVHRLKLRSLPEDVYFAVRQDGLSLSSAEVLGRVKNARFRKRCLARTLEDGLSTPEVRRLVRGESVKRSKDGPSKQEKRFRSSLRTLKKNIQRTGPSLPPERRDVVESSLETLEREVDEVLESLV